MNYRPRLSLILKGLTEITDQNDKLTELSLVVSETMGLVQVLVNNDLISSDNQSIEFQKKSFLKENSSQTNQILALEFDFQDNELVFNEALAELAGGKQNQQKLNFNSFQGSIKSTDRPKIVTELVKNFGKKTAFDIPLTIKNDQAKEGQWILKVQYLFSFDEPVRLVGALIAKPEPKEDFTPFKSIFDSAPQPTIFLNEFGVVQFFNHKAIPFFQKIFDKDLNTNQAFTDFLKGELSTTFDQIAQETLTGNSVKKSFHIRSLSGSHRWIDLNTFPIFNKSQLSIEGMVVQFQDSTNEKTKNETAEQSTQKLSMALGLTGSGAWEYDIENNRFWWSKEHRELFQIPANIEATEQNLLKNIHSDDRSSFAKALYFSIQTKQDLQASFRIETSNGVTKWIQCTGQIHFDHATESHKLLAVEADITYQKEQEARILKAERTYNDLIQVVPVGIFKTNLEGLCYFLNQPCEKIIGVSEQDANGFGWTKNLDEKDRIRFFSRWQQLISGENHHEVIEDNLQFHISGDIRQVMAQIKVERDSNGIPLGFVGTLTDVSPIVQNEKKIKKLNEILVTQYNKLRKYAHINSHDLRGPLTTIMSILNLLRSSDSRLDREYLDALLKSSDKMDSVIKELNELLKDVEFEDIVGENYSVTQSLNIMLIDDDPFQNLINSKVIQNQNKNIVLHDFNEAHKALELLIDKTLAPDFILLDLSMPIMNGWEFLEEMERNGLDYQVHILTSSINPNDFVRAKSFKNVKGFLSKPLKAELVDAILSRYIPIR